MAFLLRLIQGRRSLSDFQRAPANELIPTDHHHHSVIADGPPRYHSPNASTTALPPGSNTATPYGGTLRTLATTVESSGRPGSPSPSAEPQSRELPHSDPQPNADLEVGLSPAEAAALAEFEYLHRKRRRAIIARRVALIIIATCIYAIVLGYTLGSDEPRFSYLWGFGILLVVFYQLVLLSLRRELRLLKIEHVTFLETLENPNRSIVVNADRYHAINRQLDQENNHLLVPPPPCYAEAQMQPPAYTPKPVTQSSPPPSSPGTSITDIPAHRARLSLSPAVTPFTSLRRTSLTAPPPPVHIAHHHLEDVPLRPLRNSAPPGGRRDSVASSHSTTAATTPIMSPTEHPIFPSV